MRLRGVEGGISREGLRVAGLKTGLGKVLGWRLPSSVAWITPEPLSPGRSSPAAGSFSAGLV